jgi:hypothetical protein
VCIVSYILKEEWQNEDGDLPIGTEVTVDGELEGPINMASLGGSGWSC